MSHVPIRGTHSARRRLYLNTNKSMDGEGTRNDGYFNQQKAIQFSWTLEHQDSGALRLNVGYEIALPFPSHTACNISLSILRRVYLLAQNYHGPPPR